MVHGEDIMVKFTALQSAKVAEPKASNRQDDGLDDGLDVGMGNKVLELISENPKITMTEIAQKLNVTKRTIERAVKSLREDNRLERKGGKRYGYWEVHE